MTCSRPGVFALNTKSSLSRGLVGAYPFVERGGTLLRDFSLIKNNGVLTSMAQASDWIVTPVGYGLDFDAVDDRVICSSADPIIDDMPAVSVSVWLNSRSAGESNQGYIVAKAGDAASSAGWQLKHNFATNTRIEFRVDCSSVDMVRRSTAGEFTLNVWQHIVSTWPGTMTATDIMIYHNNQEYTFSTNTNGSTNLQSDAANKINIGNDAGGARTYDGQLSLISIWRRVLTRAEIALLYYNPWALYVRNPLTLGKAPAIITTVVPYRTLMGVGI